VAVTSGCGALTGLLSAADAIEMAAKVATMPNTSADDASNFFMGALPVRSFDHSITKHSRLL
jgi:hypothetical protein